MRLLKLNNTILIKIALLFIAAMASNLEAAAGCGGGSPVPWCDSNVYVKAIGGGKVYATGKSAEQTVAKCTQTEGRYTVLSNSHNSDIFPAATYLAAKPDDGWKFVKWECINQQGTYSTTGATAKGTILTDALPKVQKSGLSKRGGNNTGENGQQTTACTDTNAIWYAYFEQVVTQHVKVESGNPSLGTAVIDKNENNTGDEVTITAWCGNSNNSPRSETIMFLGWYKRNETTGEEEFVTRENPYTFTITDSNQGTYVAHFASGYSFWRVKNNRYNNYLTAKAKYTGAVNTNPLTLQNALSTQMGFDNDLASALTDAGTMMQIGVTGTQPRTGKEVWDFYVQDEHTNQYYGEEMIADGVFLQVTHHSNNTYIFNGNNNSFYLYENSSGDFSGTTNLLQSGYWQLEGMDKDLTTKENYFTVDPNEFVGPDNNGYYWTTLRVCFNMKYETSEITPFIVSSVDANAGTMELTEVTGGVIPAKSCVLLRCNSKDILRNVMIPTTSNATFSTNGNLLTSSTYYYKNQSVDNSLNLKGIMINDGYIGFGGNTLTQIDGNRAYLSVSSEVSLKPETPEVTLAELVKDGEVGQKYIVTDLTAVIPFDGDSQFLCKDNNGYAEKDDYSNRPAGVAADKWIDYMHQQTDLNAVPTTYDQSNWIALRLPKDGKFDINMGGATLSNVKGRLLNKVNPELLLDVMPTYQTGTGNPMPVNTFVTASFAGTNSQQGTTTDKWYFFVQPKPMELATVEWAQWNGTMFTAPAHDADHPHWNEAGLQGAFEYNDSYVSYTDELEEGYIYRMGRAIAKLKSGISEPAGAPRRAEGAAVKYVVYPLSLEQTSHIDDNGVITEVTRVGGREVTAVDYYNLAGQRSERPWQGINIVVTRYSDGTTQASKVLR